MGLTISDYEDEPKPDVKKQPGRNFSETVSATPFDIGSRATSLPAPVPLSYRHKSSPPKPFQRRLNAKRKSPRANERQKKNDYLVRKFSYIRNKPTNSEYDSAANFIGRSLSRKIKLDPDEIISIADSSISALALLGYNLQEWEELYKELTRIYDKISNIYISDELTIDSTDSDYTVAQSLLSIPKYTLEKALSKISRCIECHPEYKEKQKMKWVRWEKAQENRNSMALRQMKRYIPYDIKYLTVKDLVEKEGISWILAKRLVEKKIFQLFHMQIQDIKKVHQGDFSLNGRFDFTTLDIVELRAVYYCTKDIGVSKKWRVRMRNLLYEYTVQEEQKTLKKYTKRSHAYTYKKGRKDLEIDIKESKKEQLTLILRAQAKTLLHELESKTSLKRKRALEQVEKITGSEDNKYTRMMRHRLGIDDKASETESDTEDIDLIDEEEERKQCFDNFYKTGSFAADEKLDKKVSESDEAEIESIEQLIIQLREQVSSPEELESLLTQVFE